MKNGIDISYAQKGIDLNAAKEQGAEFVIIRGGIAQRTDTELARHVENAIKAGLPYGFYWYSRAMSTDEAAKEAECCLKAIAGYKADYPVFYDMEEQQQIYELTSKERTDIIAEFCEAIKAAGYTAGVYLNPSWLEAYVDKTRLIGKYEVWLAHWTGSPDIKSNYDYGQAMWQWGVLKINGMNVDGDVCYKEYGGKIKDDKKDDKDKDKKDKNDGKKEDGEKDFKTDLKKGNEVRLKKAALYGSSTARRRSGAVSGKYWICEDGIINGRIRITTPKGNNICTGWVRVNECEHVKSKSIKEVAEEIIKGLWGNGEERKQKLESEGYDYKEVQEIVNKLI